MEYRKSVSIILFKNNKFFIAHRPKWGKKCYDFIQGGIEKREAEEEAVLREIKEELNISNVKVIAKSKYEYKYNWPKERQKKEGYLGQKQTLWFVKFNSGKIKTNPEEYDKWVWADDKQLLKLNEFKNKKELKENLIKEFKGIIKTNCIL